MKKLLAILALLLVPTFVGAQLTTQQGGTGSTTPFGILYGNNTLHLQTVTIGSGCTFTGGTLSCPGTGGGGSYPFPLAGNATSTLTNFLGGIGATTIQATSTATSTIANDNTTLWVPTDFATKGCAGNPADTDFGTCVNALNTQLNAKGLLAGQIMVPDIHVLQSQWSVPIVFSGPTIISFDCPQGAQLSYGGTATSTLFKPSDSTGHITSEDYGCTYMGNNTLNTTGQTNTNTTVGVGFGGSAAHDGSGASGIDFYDNSINGFGKDIQIAANAYMLTLYNNSVSAGNGGVLGDLLYVDKSANSGEALNLDSNKWIDPGNGLAGNDVYFSSGGNESATINAGVLDDAQLFDGTSNGTLTITGLSIENSACQGAVYNNYIPILGVASDQFTQINIQGLEVANDCSGALSFVTIIRHGGQLSLTGWHIDNYAGGTVTNLVLHDLDNGLESEQVCKGSVGGGTLTNIIGGSGAQPYSLAASAACWGDTSNSYAYGSYIDGSNLAHFRNGSQDVATADNNGNWTFLNKVGVGSNTTPSDFLQITAADNTTPLFAATASVTNGSGFFNIDKFATPTSGNGFIAQGQSGNPGAAFEANPSSDSTGFQQVQASPQTKNFLSLLTNSFNSLFAVGPKGNLQIGTTSAPTAFAWEGIQAAGTSAYGDQTPLLDIASVTSATYATTSLFRVNPSGEVQVGQSLFNGAAPIAGLGTSVSQFVISQNVNNLARQLDLANTNMGANAEGGITFENGNSTNGGAASTYIGGLVMGGPNFATAGFSGLSPNGMALFDTDGSLAIGATSANPASTTISFYGGDSGGFGKGGADMVLAVPTISGQPTVHTVSSGGNAFLGVGTTSPQWVETLYGSTTPQLALGSNTTDTPWTFREVGNNLYIATASPTTYSTSTLPAFSITPNGTTTINALNILGTSSGTSTSAVGFNITTGCYAIAGTCLSTGGGGAVSSVSNSDGTLTISPTTGSVVASLALAHANTWTGLQTFNNATATLLSSTLASTTNLVVSNSASTTNLSVSSNLYVPLTISCGGANTCLLQANTGTGDGRVTGVVLPASLNILGSLGLNTANANTWSVNQSFNYSSSTVYSSFVTASSTFANIGNLTLSTSTVGCLNVSSTGGVYSATCGSFTNTIANGGTGSTSFAPNSIITSNAAGTALIATGTQLTVGNLLATTSTATSTFNGSVKIATTSATALNVTDAFGTTDLNLQTSSTTGPIFQVQATSTSNILFQIDQYGHLLASSTGATPTISSCGTGSPSMGANANDVVGDFTTGTSASACTITYASPYSSTPEVLITDSNTSAVVDVSSRSTTGFTISLASALSADNVSYMVIMP